MGNPITNSVYFSFYKTIVRFPGNNYFPIVQSFSKPSQQRGGDAAGPCTIGLIIIPRFSFASPYIPSALRVRLLWLSQPASTHTLHLQLAAFGHIEYYLSHICQSYPAANHIRRVSNSFHSLTLLQHQWVHYITYHIYCFYMLHDTWPYITCNI
jgi:hypothetical protein